MNITQYLWAPRSIEYLWARCLRNPIVLCQARRGLIFTAARRSRSQGLFHTSPWHAQRDGGRRGPFWPGGRCSAGFCTRLGESSAPLVCCHSFCRCYPSLLIPLLLLESCSEHSPCSLPFEPSILLFIPLQGAGRLSKQHIVLSVSVGAQNWRITSLNHNTHLFEHNSLTHLP